jgi:hypothetical protein
MSGLYFYDTTLPYYQTIVVSIFLSIFKDSKFVISPNGGKAMGDDM